MLWPISYKFQLIANQLLKFSFGPLAPDFRLKHIDFVN